MTHQESLYGKTPDQLAALCGELGMPRFAARQIARWLYVRHTEDPLRMTDIAAAHRQRLAERFSPALSAPERVTESADGTKKYLFRTLEGHYVESAYIPDGERATLCVSSQAGCRMGCRFCMTGHGGFQGNLTTAGIMNQILSVEESDRLTNEEYLGLGAPLDNLDAVIPAIEILTAPWGFAWSPKRITVSTVGASLTALERLLDTTKVHLAVSIHNPFTAARAAILPAERALPATRLLESLRSRDWSGQRRLSVEYIMWRGVNDDLRHSEALARLLRGLDVRVNLIRYHATPMFEGQPPTRQTMEAFRDHLNARDITATIRASRGEDIAAACGMLAGAGKPEKS